MMAKPLSDGMDSLDSKLQRFKDSAEMVDDEVDCHLANRTTDGFAGG